MLIGKKRRKKALCSDSLITIVKNSGKNVKCSMCLMGLGQLMYGQILKGILFLTTEIVGILYIIFAGVKNLSGFITLGTVESDGWSGIVGDDSTTLLLFGILNWMILIAFVVMYITNIKDCYATQLRVQAGNKPLKFREDVKELFNKKFYVTMLFIPIIAVLVFNVLPILFMICIAFTNYGGKTVPPKLIKWVGLDNFKNLITLGQFAPTFLKILRWNIVWAVLSTACSYFGGLGIALLLNKKCVKGKSLWRAFPVLAYATPGFIVLIGFKFMFSYGGPINQIIQDLGRSPIGFLSLDAKWSSRIIGLLVNTWISIPSIMLLATGMIANMDQSLYEAARIDGASRFKQFTHITLPFMIFTTTPVIITQFISNFNNFGIFYFLRNKVRNDGYFIASDTDLLINWLYNLSIDNNYYAIGAAVSLILFVITSIISIGIYTKSSSYRQEDMYR